MATVSEGDVMDVPQRKSCNTYAECSYSQRYCIMNAIKVIGIDLAKLLDTIRQFPADSMIAMESCATWGPHGKRVESRCGAVIFQVRHICCRLLRLPMPYFPDHKSHLHTPLIEPDVRF